MYITPGINEATITQQMEAHQYLYLIGAAVNLPSMSAVYFHFL